MNVLYPAVFNYDAMEKRYTVIFPDLSEAITEAETLGEAYFNASEVLTITLEGRMDEGMHVPQPTQLKDAKLIAPSARVQSALLVRWAKGDHSSAELARTLGTSWPAIARLEDPHHWSSVRQLERVAAALGQQLVISLQPVNVAQA